MRTFLLGVIAALTLGGWLTPAFAQPDGLSVDEAADAIVAKMKAGERSGMSLTITHQPLDKEIRQLEAARDQAYDRGRADEGAFLERKLIRRIELQRADEGNSGPEGTSGRVGALFSSAQEEFADEEAYYRSIGREDLAQESAKKLRQVQVSEAVSTRWKAEIERMGEQADAEAAESSASCRERVDAMARQGAGLLPWPVREPDRIFRPGAAGSSSRALSPLPGGVFRPGAPASATPSSLPAFRRENTVTRSGSVSGSKLARPTPRTAPTQPPSSFGKRDFRGYSLGGASGSSSSSSRTFRPSR